MPSATRRLMLPPKALETRRQFEQDLGLSEGSSAVLRDLMDTVMPATGPAGVAAGMMEPPRETSVAQGLLPLALSIVPLMLGKRTTAGQSRFKELATTLRGKLKGTAVAEDLLGQTRKAPKRVFHGTTATFEQFDPAKRGKGAGGDLYGPGFYFSESPEVVGSQRGGYAFLGAEDFPEIDKQIAKDKRTLFGLDRIKAALEDPTPRNLQLAREIKMLQEPDVERLLNSVEAEAKGSPNPGEAVDFFKSKLQRTIEERLQEVQGIQPNVRPAFLDIKRPFDIHGKIPMNEAEHLLRLGTKIKPENFKYRFFGSMPSEGIDGTALYGALLQATNENKNTVTKILQKAGYDGITHIGGAVAGGAPHRVWIAFHPEQVIPAFAEGAPTRGRQRPSYKLLSITPREE